MKILITAGPTYERIDPVRFIGNYSSGKMGFALAEEASKRGFQVLLISGPVRLKTKGDNIMRIDVESAQQMYEQVDKYIEDADVAIFCAAVADFTPEEVHSQKVKRGEDDLIIRLKPTKDIAAMAGSRKREEQFFVGFALETNDEEVNAIKKIKKKNLDMIVLNSLNDKGAGFGYDTNKVKIIYKDGTSKEYPLMKKSRVAEEILNVVGKHTKK